MRAKAYGPGWAHRQRVGAIFLTRKKTLTNCIVLLTGFEPGSCESDALPIEPPRHPIVMKLAIVWEVLMWAANLKLHSNWSSGQLADFTDTEYTA